MHIELILDTDHTEVVFTNISSTSLRLWELSNSWGWRSVSFQIKGEQETNISTIMRLWNTEWTKNGPSTFALAPGEIYKALFYLDDGWWMRDQTISRLKDKTVLVRVSYKADPPESDLLGSINDPDAPDWAKTSHDRWDSEIENVFTGSVFSDWVMSQPPHDWLLGQAPYRGETAGQLLHYPSEEVLSRIVNLIDHLAWNIQLNAKVINEDSMAPLTIVEKLNIGMTVGHLVNGILEYSEEIQTAVNETRAYLEAKAQRKSGSETDAESQV